jgi:hypothetical protein
MPCRAGHPEKIHRTNEHRDRECEWQWGRDAPSRELERIARINLNR